MGDVIYKLSWLKRGWDDKSGPNGLPEPMEDDLTRIANGHIKLIALEERKERSRIFDKILQVALIVDPIVRSSKLVALNFARNTAKVMLIAS